MKKTAFIGAGNMGRAIIAGLLKNPLFCPDDILVCDKALKKEIVDMGIRAASLEEAVKCADVVVIAVKPNVIFDVCENIAKCDINGKTFISIAAGITLDSLQKALGTGKLVRVMPNLCLMAGEGMSVLARGNEVSDSEMDFAKSIFDCAGKTAIVPENLIDSCTAINGSGPAYVFMFIEALTRAGVMQGIDRETSLSLTLQTIIGAAKMVSETKDSPEELKERVCSPGGTTIEAVKVFEEKELYSTVASAVDACAKKAKFLSGNK